jgi:hypothetical protein
MDMHSEVSVGQTIADVVIVLRTLEGRSPLRRALTAAESVFLARLRRDGGAPVDDVERDLRFREGELLTDPRVRDLIDARLIGISNGVIRANASWMNRNVRIIAIEAKVTRWRNALQQASQYGRYADHVYVALPETAAHAASKHAMQFRNAGIGLLQVTTGNLKTLIAAQRHSDHDWRREFVASRLLPAGR